MKAIGRILLIIAYSFFFYLILGAEKGNIGYAAILGTFYNILEEINSKLDKKP